MTESLTTQIQALVDMPRDQLTQKWEAAFDCPAPSRVHSSVLRSAIAWHLQMKSQSTWSVARIRKMLNQSGSMITVQNGARLIREWQGQTHVVNVLDARYEYQGRVYKSLSAIAREITGTAWSGPLFFGLKS
jgi:hypothetical protein